MGFHVHDQSRLDCQYYRKTSLDAMVSTNSNPFDTGYRNTNEKSKGNPSFNQFTVDQVDLVQTLSATFQMQHLDRIQELFIDIMQVQLLMQPCILSLLWTLPRASWVSSLILGILDLIQVFVEALDRVFVNVCELDLVFRPEDVNRILGEMISGGLVLETDVDQIVAQAGIEKS